MNTEKKAVVTEEPLPGWLRFEVEGQKPWFKTPIPRTVIRDGTKLDNYLDKEHKNGRMMEIDGKEFSFKRRLGLKSKSEDSNSEKIVDSSCDNTIKEGDSETEKKSSDVVTRLTRTGDLVDHKKILSNSAKDLDSFRGNDGYGIPSNFEELKRKVSSSADLRAMLTVLSKTPVYEAMKLMFSDTCLSEISKIDTKAGPLVDFPTNINENVYAETVEFGMKNCPTLIHFVTGMVVRRGEPVFPSDVLKIATLFSSICFVVNHDLDALIKLRSLTLQIDGLTNIGLDILSDLGLAQCARSLSNHRDMLADIGPQVMNTAAANFPYQSTIDNCDMMSEHLTVEVIEKECVDTSKLFTSKMSKDEALNLFTIEQVLLGHEQNKEELEHFLYVIAVAAGRVLAERRPEASKLKKYLPVHHKHENSDRSLSPALSFIVKPYPLQETKNPDTIKLLVKIQRQYLKAIAKSKHDDPEFLELLKLLEDPSADEAEREAAEKEVKEACRVFGEWVGHGDLLTVKMIMEAMMMMAGSATAFGRLEFLGPVRLQMLHMKMKKVSQDYSLCMPNEINYDDVLSLAWLTALTRMKVSNKEKDIKKNDSSFERHDQFLTAVQCSYLANMFDTYVDKNPDKLNDVTNTEEATKFILGMLDEFNIQLFYDPSREEPEKVEGEDDLFNYCKDMVSRLLLSLVFDICESEGDAEGLRALRRVMVCYFLAKKPERKVIW